MPRSLAEKVDDLVTVLSLPTPPKCFAASILASLHAAFARKVRARPSGCSAFEALWVHLRYGPATRSPSLKMASSIGFRMESFLPTLLFKLRGLDSYPGGTFTHCSCQPSLDAHLSALFLSIRNIATCFALGVLGQALFSRHAALKLPSEFSVPISGDCYRILERARILCTRSMGADIRTQEVQLVRSECESINRWMKTLTEKAEIHGRIQ
jgi:hypothetical protein